MILNTKCRVFAAFLRTLHHEWLYTQLGTLLIFIRIRLSDPSTLLRNHFTLLSLNRARMGMRMGFAGFGFLGALGGFGLRTQRVFILLRSLAYRVGRFIYFELLVLVKVIVVRCFIVCIVLGLSCSWRVSRINALRFAHVISRSYLVKHSKFARTAPFLIQI